MSVLLYTEIICLIIVLDGDLFLEAVYNVASSNETCKRNVKVFEKQPKTMPALLSHR